MTGRTYRKGAGGALMDEYERAAAELRACIADISDQELVHITDPHTTDENCRSVQTVLSHVVHAGYGYATYIQNTKGISMERPAKTFHPSVTAYINDLGAVITFTDKVMATIPDTALEEPDEAKKIRSPWAQTYDIEQMMEHAIVHILRHRRQIERFKVMLRS